jgi:superfamily II DNA or RNA helicase
VLHVHPTGYRYDGDADPSRPGGMTAIYRDLAADEQRTRQVTAEILTVLGEDRNCLVLTNRTSHLERLAGLLCEAGHDPVILAAGWAKTRTAALTRLQRQPGGPPLEAVDTSAYAGEGLDCPALDTLFLAAPVASKGSLTQYTGRILGNRYPAIIKLWEAPGPSPPSPSRSCGSTGRFAR